MKTLRHVFPALGILLSATSAFANGVVVPGGPTIQDGSTTFPADTVSPPDPTTAEISFTIALEPNRSYACSLIAKDDLTDLDFHSVLDPGNALVAVGVIGDVTPALAGDTGDTGNNRIAIIPSGQGTQTAGKYTVNVANQTRQLLGTSSLSAVGRVDCIETTLYGGYNTSISEFNFLEVLNTTNTAIAGAITATNSDGTVVINQQIFNVAPNRRVDIDLHTAAGPGKFGLIQVVHTGPYGALQAFVSQYEGPISNFALTASLALRPRDK